MKKDAEVRLLFKERRKGASQALAAARTGMSERTARTYEHAGVLPSARTHVRTHRTRPNPFADDWPWIVEQLTRDSALQATTLLALLNTEHPGRYGPGQVRTLQRHIAVWRAAAGPDKEVIFSQVHQPGVLAQSDFTHMSDLHVTLAGSAFPHLIYHLVLAFSNVEAVRIAPSETFEALAEGLEWGLWQIGGVPLTHRTDHLSAALRPLDAEGKRLFGERYTALMTHYKMQPTTNNLGVAHENGDVEQAHYRFKEAVDQALRVRGSRDFADRVAYDRFLQDLVRQRNLTRQVRFAQERETLRPLPDYVLAPCRDVRVSVSRFSTMYVCGNTYSVPSRLIGSPLTVRVRAEWLECYVGTTPVVALPRLQGTHGHQINYRHIIGSLVRKPGAFAGYRYREDLYPTLAFRYAYDALTQARPVHADRDYVRVLFLAATVSESEVETALILLRDAGLVPTFDAVRDLVRAPQDMVVPAVAAPVYDLTRYDHLLGALPHPTERTVADARPA